MSKHTPELEVSDQSAYLGYRTFASFDGLEIRLEQRGNNGAVARITLGPTLLAEVNQFAAQVNACAGITDPAELRDRIDLTPQQYHAGLDKLWVALGITTVQTDDVFTLAAVSIAELRTQRDELLAACKATILFHSGCHWDAEARAEWKRLTGEDDANTVKLCDACCDAVAKAEEGTT